MPISFCGSGTGGSSSTSASGVAGPSASASSPSRSGGEQLADRGAVAAEHVPGVDHAGVAQNAGARTAVGAVGDDAHDVQAIRGGPRAWPAAGRVRGKMRR